MLSISKMTWLSSLTGNMNLRDSAIIFSASSLSLAFRLDLTRAFHVALFPFFCVQVSRSISIFCVAKHFLWLVLDVVSVFLSWAKQSARESVIIFNTTFWSSVSEGEVSGANSIRSPSVIEWYTSCSCAWCFIFGDESLVSSSDHGKIKC